MPHRVTIDDDVFVALQEQAVPLVDDLNSVLRRLLRVGEGGLRDDPAWTSPTGSHIAPTSSRRLAKGVLLPAEEYRIPLLEALEKEGGRAPAGVVIDRVGEKPDARLGEPDRSITGTGQIRWRNRVQFVRLDLKNRGLLKSDSPNGVWEISDEGRAYLRDRSGQD